MITKNEIARLSAAICKIALHPASDSVTVNAISAAIEDALFEIADPKKAEGFAYRANGGVLVLGRASAGLDYRLKQRNAPEDTDPPPGDLMTIVAKVRGRADDINRDLDVLEGRLKEREIRQ